ncbi:hypothetical protein [Moraxella lacunata]
MCYSFQYIYLTKNSGKTLNKPAPTKKTDTHRSFLLTKFTHFYQNFCYT